MYYEGRKIKEEKQKPFTIICNNCGSHDVTATAYEYYDLGIHCNNCGAHLSNGLYNEKDYRGD